MVAGVIGGDDAHAGAVVLYPDNQTGRVQNAEITRGGGGLGAGQPRPFLGVQPPDGGAGGFGRQGLNGLRHQKPAAVDDGGQQDGDEDGAHKGELHGGRPSAIGDGTRR